MSEVILAIKNIITKSTKRPMVLISTNVKDHWVTAAQWKSKGLSMNVMSFVKGAFDADYYQKDDQLFDGTIATDSDIILRDFSASQHPSVVAETEAIRLMKQEDEINMASALFARNRKPRIAVVAPTVGADLLS